MRPKVPTKAQRRVGLPPHPRILVLDDHLADRARMAELLRQAGYLVLEAGWAVEVTPLTAALSPALCVIDIFLPGPSPAELIRRLRATPAFVETPILAVSAGRSAEARHLALTAGATAFLPKPLDPQAFLATVAHLVRRAPQAGGAEGGPGQGP